MSEILVPENIKPYVDVLGIDGAFDFFMQFGGADTYFTLTPGADSSVVRAIGRDQAIALAGRLNVPPNTVEVPVAKPFMARVLQQRGMAIAEIARQLHVTKVTARAMLSCERQKREAARPAPARLQLSMFDDD